uniref:Protein O-mannosyl-transferase 1-like n=1 Tax=Saccoglossus kowalevskii TaxID=10224 RepID=A0ABM0N1G8_SACKO|nr:PREDICTED: protein O-mannosyl-transferase 1-like [Saccoglossus kowalevskii]
MISFIDFFFIYRFDEVHFGQFTALYLKRTFFFDVHPPLGKLLFTAVGYFAGFDENFVFAKIGAEYPVNVPVWHLRALSALFGTFLCPVVYQIIAELGFSHWSAMLAGFLVLFGSVEETVILKGSGSPAACVQIK